MRPPAVRRLKNSRRCATVFSRRRIDIATIKLSAPRRPDDGSRARRRRRRWPSRGAIPGEVLHGRTEWRGRLTGRLVQSFTESRLNLDRSPDRVVVGIDVVVVGGGYKLDATSRRYDVMVPSSCTWFETDWYQERADKADARCDIGMLLCSID